jgi:hypothetical protein
MTKVYTAFIGLAILAQVILLVFLGKEDGAYGPVLFWVIALVAMIHYIMNNRALANSIKITNPELHKKHCIGRMEMRSALDDKAFVSALNEFELGLLETNKRIMHYLLVCTVLFALSGLVVSLM